MASDSIQKNVSRPPLQRENLTPDIELAPLRRSSDPARVQGMRARGRPPRHPSQTSRQGWVPTLATPYSPEALNFSPVRVQQEIQQDYFANVRMAPEPERRRSSVAKFLSDRRQSVAKAFGGLTEAFNPPEAEMVEPFSFESTKTSWWSSFNLTLGLLGQAGYTMGAACIEHNTVDIAPPPGITAGVGSGRPTAMDGMPKWYAPPLAGSIAITALGVVFGITSSMLFLRDGLRIAGNKRKAYFYVTMHLIGICLISLSRTIIDYRKNHTPHAYIIALTIPASLGRGIHWVTIPRSFSNSEVIRGDFARLSFDQRQKLSEGLRILAAIFFGLWAGSWAVQDYNPLEREVYAILGSLTLNVSAALPNTNLRRADIFRRSQVSMLNSQLSTYRLDSPSIRSPTNSPRPPVSTYLPSPPPQPHHAVTMPNPPTEALT